MTHNKKVWYILPSLVQHKPDIKSLCFAWGEFDKKRIGGDEARINGEKGIPNSERGAYWCIQ
jgi:hypothetical protein